VFWKEVISEQLNLLDGKRKIPIDVDNVHTEFTWDTTHHWTSLLNASESLYMNVAGAQPSDLKRITDLVHSLNLRSQNKINFNFNQTVNRGEFNGATPERKWFLGNQSHLSEGEYTTVTELQNYCKRVVASGKKAMVYYVHNKGGCCFRKKASDRSPVASWRDVMNAAIVEFPSICTRALMKVRHFSLLD
jgi:hypothetical protein